MTSDDLVLIALGANLPSDAGGPRNTCEAALTMMGEQAITVDRRSRWYRSAPVPASSQPWFVNGVVSVTTALAADALLTRLLDIEMRLGRTRGERWAARVIDLDLLAYRGMVCATSALELPHPRLHERAFVLLPLADVAPTWRHPVLGKRVGGLIEDLPSDYSIETLR
jgi:2-amino-4-hydroxy-6-hydroxymethyldihydropteridine diphosphokinase